MSGVMEKLYVVEMPDGTKWGVPVYVIAESKAMHYKEEYDGDMQRCLDEEIIPVFEDDYYEIHDWASGNMNWDEVEKFAVKISDPQVNSDDYQDGWVNGQYHVAERPSVG